jgi:hypothetical protein
MTPAKISPAEGLRAVKPACDDAAKGPSRPQRHLPLQVLTAISGAHSGKCYRTYHPL